MTTITNGGWIEEIPQVEIERMANGNVRLTDKTDMNGDHMVDLHPIHLRLIAERLGPVDAMSDTEARALRTVDKLARRLRVLHERIAFVHGLLWDLPARDFDCCDVNAEAWHLDGTLDLSTEFLAEIEESGAVRTPRETRPVPAAIPAGTRRVWAPTAPQRLDLGGRP